MLEDNQNVKITLTEISFFPYFNIIKKFNKKTIYELHIFFWISSFSPDSKMINKKIQIWR